MPESDTKWTAEVSRPDDIDLEVTLDSDGTWRWTVWFIRLIRSGTAETLEAAQAGAVADLKEMAERYKTDLSPNLYRAIRSRTAYHWKEHQ